MRDKSNIPHEKILRRKAQPSPRCQRTAWQLTVASKHNSRKTNTSPAVTVVRDVDKLEADMERMLL